VTQAGPSSSRLRWSVHVETYESATAHVVSVAGRLGSATAADLERILDRSLTAGHIRLLLDLSGVDYLSSMGLAVMERTAARARAAGGALVLAGLQEPVRVAFDVSGASARLDVAADMAEASSRLQAG
jgi:anti-anti-sigma factor